MITLHLNYHELSIQTQNELKRHIRNNFLVSHPNIKYSKKVLKTSLVELFDTNNAGIDIDIFELMI